MLEHKPARWCGAIACPSCWLEGKSFRVRPVFRAVADDPEAEPLVAFHEVDERCDDAPDALRPLTNGTSVHNDVDHDRHTNRAVCTIFPTQVYSHLVGSRVAAERRGARRHGVQV